MRQDMGSDTSEEANSSLDVTPPRPAASPEPGSRRGDDPMSVTKVVNAVLRRRLLLIWLPLSLMVLVMVITLLTPPSYTARASFTPQQADAAQSALAGLIGQTGLPIGRVMGAQSPDFYAELLESRELLRSLATTEYTVSLERRDRLLRKHTETVTGDLTVLLEIESEAPEQAREAAVERVRNLMAVTVSRASGIVSMRVSTPSPSLSAAILERTLELVQQFNTQARQTRAAAERRFIEGRLEETREEMLAAENALQQFLDQNRAFQQSPQLTFEYDRLHRESVRRQELFASLAQAFEQARIDEVRNTPVVTVIEHPVEPAFRDRRMLLIKGFLALVVGFLVAGMFALLGELVVNGRRGPIEDLNEFELLKRDTLDDLGRLRERLRHPFSATG
jgi:uncharacterized protein involved in exopolysaccharide biosynthesis